MKKAMAGEPGSAFVILNSDSFWMDANGSNISAMKQAWAPSRMDMLLLVTRKEQSVGYDGAGDFFMNEEGLLSRRGDAPSAPYIYAGAIIALGQDFSQYPANRFSLNQMFDRAITQGRLCGHPLDGLWLHVGTPASIAQAEQAIEQQISHLTSSVAHSDP